MKTWLIFGWLGAGAALCAANGDLGKEFARPPAEARPWVYWWWLNGSADKQGITRDMEEMSNKGIGGALIFDSGEAGAEVPKGPPFMSTKWRELFKHALHEADRCGIALSVNLCSGWDCGGPWVTQEHAAKKLTTAQTTVIGSKRLTLMLPRPQAVQGFYQDIAVLATQVAAPNGYQLTASSSQTDYPPVLAQDHDEATRWVSQGDKPGMGPTPQKPEFVQFDCNEPRVAAGMWLKPNADCGPKDVEIQCSDDGHTFRPLQRVTLLPAEERIITFTETRAKYFRLVCLTSYPFRGENWNVQVAEIALLTADQVHAKEKPAPFRWNPAAVVDLTKMVDAKGQLNWDAPAGCWRIARCGYTLHGINTVNVGSGPGGPEIDPMSAEAMDLHFAATGAKLLADAGPLAGKTLQYFHLDSWEIRQPNWTPMMREEFQRRRGYDLLPWLPWLAAGVRAGDAQTDKVVQDYRRTIADLVAQNYYGHLAELSVKGGLLGTHSESGGPGNHWIDALQCEGKNAAPMGEFWNRQSEPNGPISLYGPDNASVKQAAAAAHIYGRPVCQAEAFTSLADDFTEDPWCMKDIGDSAFCAGLTRMLFCYWTLQPGRNAKPGFNWTHIGTHFDRNLTWWPMADGWLSYLARCQHMLRQGLFVADFAYLQNEAIPMYTPRRSDQQPARPAGFDYDPINAEVLLTRASAKDGCLTLPDGMSYRYLILPYQSGAILSADTLKKVNELADAGVRVIGPKTFAGSVPKLRDGPLATIVQADNLLPDLELRNPAAAAHFDWIHRRNEGIDIYFISNQSMSGTSVQAVCRATGRQPELWDAVTGEMRELPDWREENGRTVVPLQFAPRQSWFVVFRKKLTDKPAVHPPAANFPATTAVMTLLGPWQVQFDPAWFYPDDGSGGKLQFAALDDWSKRPEPAVRHFAGIATYRHVFGVQPAVPRGRMLIDLGVIKNLARVRLNGCDLGTIWTAPWRVAIPAGLLQPAGNELEIDVANLWPNRLIADGQLPPGERRTTSNIHTYDPVLSNTNWSPGSLWGRSNCPSCISRLKNGKPAELLVSGLLGPVRLLAEEK